MQERPRPGQSQLAPQQTYKHSPGINRTRRVRHATEQGQDVSQTNVDDELESIDPESTLYLQELTEEWANINWCNHENLAQYET